MSDRAFYRGKLFVFGIMVLGVGFWLAAKSWVFRSDLVPVTGTLHSAEIYIQAVEGRKQTSNLSRLIFTLRNQGQEFILQENIGNGERNLEYERIQRKLKAALTITVYVHEDETAEPVPKVYGIDGDGATILSFDSVRTEHSQLAIWMLVLGIGSILFVFYQRNKLRQ